MNALTGAAGAALLGLDGFREIDWPRLYCSHFSARKSAYVVKTRHPVEATLVEDVLVAHPALVLRHLGNQVDVLRASETSLR